jgi:hypothetical protein
LLFLSLGFAHWHLSSTTTTGAINAAGAAPTARLDERSRHALFLSVTLLVFTFRLLLPQLLGLPLIALTIATLLTLVSAAVFCPANLVSLFMCS